MGWCFLTRAAKYQLQHRPRQAAYKIQRCWRRHVEYGIQEARVKQLLLQQLRVRPSLRPALALLSVVALCFVRLCGFVGLPHRPA